MTAPPSKGRPGRPRVRLDLDHARSLRDSGLSWRQIAHVLGVGKTTVIRYLAGPNPPDAPHGGPKPAQNPPTPHAPGCPRCGHEIAS